MRSESNSADWIAWLKELLVLIGKELDLPVGFGYVEIIPAIRALKGGCLSQEEQAVLDAIAAKEPPPQADPKTGEAGPLNFDA